MEVIDKGKRGISLIILVITIIIMIILAAAVILSLNSSNVVSKATEAKSKSEWSAAEDRKTVMMSEILLKRSDLNEIIESEIVGNFEISQNETNPKVLDIKYIEGDKKALIPGGFSYVTGTINTGMVIADSEGNEFVWIPVDNITEFERQAGYLYDSPQSWSTTNYPEPYLDGYPNEEEEYNVMKASVAEHKGFYIGRYEAGSKTPRQYYYSAEENGTTEMVVKKGAYIYNNVGWGQSMTSTTGDIMQEVWEESVLVQKSHGKGAVQLSKEMYEESRSVVSHLIYGVEWDAALRFIDPSFTGYAKDRDGNKGNYNGNLQSTGYYAEKNIYDMGGNAWEWTMESVPPAFRAHRGGCSNDGVNYTASSREISTPEYTNGGIGFRVSLHIK